MRVIGAKPKPRGLIWGFDENTAGRIADLFATSRQIQSTEEIRQAEWDVLVTDQNFDGVERHLYGLGFGCDYFGTTTLPSGNYVRHFYVRFQGETIATEFLPGDSLDLPLQRLVQRQLVPLAQSRPTNPVLFFEQFAAQSQGQVGQVTPFLRTTEPKILAGSFSRPEGSDIWCLPARIDDPVPWVATALSIWHKRDNVKFPVDPLWRDSPAWLTLDEMRTVDGLKRLEGARARALIDFQSKEALLRAELDEARMRADQGLRLLLTGTGDELVNVVQESLEALGFSVSNRDTVNPPQDRREDLWVTSPSEDPNWIAIVEVRGYSKGAAQGDLLRLSGRFAKRFMQDQEREPDRMWYLVNQFAGSDPSSRPTVLGTNPGEVAAFAEEGGMAMDTASLFELVKRVASGELAAEEVRKRMMLATGSWTT